MFQAVFEAMVARRGGAARLCLTPFHLMTLPFGLSLCHSIENHVNSMIGLDAERRLRARPLPRARPQQRGWRGRY
jgi:hypothetical protein